MKKSVALSVMVATSLLISACASKASQEAQSAATEGPIKVGLVAITSGPLAEIGESHKAGAELAVRQINAEGGISGRQVELVFKDEKGDPDTAVQAARDLLGQGVKLIAGYTLDPTCLAASPIITNGGGVMVGLSCQGDALTGDKLTNNYFQIAPTNSMLSKATAEVARQSGIKTWQGIGPDYDFGREVWARFVDALGKEKAGKDVYVPLDATQVSPYINSLMNELPKDSTENTGLFMSTFSATTIGLAKQGAPYKFFDRYGEVLNLGGSTPTAEALKGDTPRMTFIYDYFDEAYKNAVNDKFVAGYKAANNGARPNAWAYEGYTALLAIKAAIVKANSSDPGKIATAMVGLSFEGPKGTFAFGKNHLLESPVTAWKVVGDKAAPQGFTVLSSQAIPVQQGS